MTFFTSNIDLKGLANLLKTENKSNSDDDDEYDFSKNNFKVMNSSFNEAGENAELGKEKATKNYNCVKIVKSSKDIWDDDEILHEEDDEVMTKEKPEYEMMYEQSVTPDDVFLQLSGKGPGTDNCECMLVKIKLPGVHSKDEVNLNISASKLICKTKRYYLNLDFPKEVNPVKCSAKWDQTQSLLLVKLHFETEDILAF